MSELTYIGRDGGAPVMPGNFSPRRGPARRVLAALVVILALLVAASVGYAAHGSTKHPTTTTTTVFGQLPKVNTVGDSCLSTNVTTLSGLTTFLLNVRNLTATLQSPTASTCVVVDGDGSGASIELNATGDDGSQHRGHIVVATSACVGCNLSELCHHSTFYSHEAASSQYPCEGGTPSGEVVRYLTGSRTSNGVTILVTDPAGSQAPLSFSSEPYPQTTVLHMDANNVLSSYYCYAASSLSYCGANVSPFVHAVTAGQGF